MSTVPVISSGAPPLALGGTPSAASAASAALLTLPALSALSVQSAATSGALTIQFVVLCSMGFVSLCLTAMSPPLVFEARATWVLCACFVAVHVSVFAWSHPSRWLLHGRADLSRRSVCVLLLLVYACAPWVVWFVGHRCVGVDVVPPLPVWTAQFQLTQLLLVCYHLDNMRNVSPDHFTENCMGDRLMCGLRVWGWPSLLSSGIASVVMRCSGVPMWSSASLYNLCSDVVGGDFYLEFLLHFAACVFAYLAADDRSVMSWTTELFSGSSSDDRSSFLLVQRLGDRAKGMSDTVVAFMLVCCLWVGFTVLCVYRGKGMPMEVSIIILAAVAAWRVRCVMRRGAWPCPDPCIEVDVSMSTRKKLSVYSAAYGAVNKLLVMQLIGMKANVIGRLVDRLDGDAVARASASVFFVDGVISEDQVALLRRTCALTVAPVIPRGICSWFAECVTYVLGCVCCIGGWPVYAGFTHTWVTLADNVVSQWLCAQCACTLALFELLAYYLLALMATAVVGVTRLGGNATESVYIRVLDVFNETASSDANTAAGRPDLRRLNYVFENCTQETYAALVYVAPWIPLALAVFVVQCLLGFVAVRYYPLCMRKGFGGYVLSAIAVCFLARVFAWLVSYPFSNDFSLGTLVHYGIAHVYTEAVTRLRMQDLEMQRGVMNSSLRLIADALLVAQNRRDLAAFSARSALDVLISDGCGSPTRFGFGPGVALLAYEMDVGYTSDTMMYVDLYCGSPQWHDGRNPFYETREAYLNLSIATFARAIGASSEAPVRIGIGSCAAGGFNATCNASNSTGVETFASFGSALAPMDVKYREAAIREGLVVARALRYPAVERATLAFVDRTLALIRDVEYRRGFGGTEQALAAAAVDTEAKTVARMSLLGVTKDTESGAGSIPHARGLVEKKPWTWNRLLPPCAREPGQTIPGYFKCYANRLVERNFGVRFL